MNLNILYLLFACTVMILNYMYIYIVYEIQQNSINLSIYKSMFLFFVIRIYKYDLYIYTLHTRSKLIPELSRFIRNSSD